MSLPRMKSRAGGALALVRWLLLALASLPLLLFAFLGQYSRMMGDDYARFATALQMGGWHNFSHWWTNWDGSYSGILFHDLIAPLGAPAIPRVFPTVALALWWAGLFWLFALALAELGIRRRRGFIAALLASLVAGGAVNAFATWESIYWYTACVDNTLPVGGLLLYLALVFKLSQAQRSRAAMWLAAGAGGASCLVIGGFSEMHAVYQLLYLSLLLGLIFRFDRGPARNRRLALLTAGWVGSLASLLLQLASPGVAYRINSAATVGGLQPMQSADALALETLRLTLDYFGHPGGVIGFMLMLAVGLALAMLLPSARTAASSDHNSSLGLAPPGLGLLTQMAVLAILSRQLSELALMSPLEAIALACPLLSGAVFALLIWRRRWLATWLRNHEARLLPLSACLLSIALALMGLTQLPSASWTMSSCLFITALAWLGNLLALLLSFEAEARSQPVWRAALGALAMTVIAIAAPVVTGLYFNGVVYSRVMSSPALIIALAGLAWGFCIGVPLSRACQLRVAGPQWRRGFAKIGGMLAAAILLGVVANQLRLVPKFAAYAGDWDARHERVIRLRDEGVLNIETPPFSFDMTAFIAASGQTIGGSDAYFYGVESIRVIEP